MTMSSRSVTVFPSAGSHSGKRAPAGVAEVAASVGASVVGSADASVGEGDVVGAGSDPPPEQAVSASSAPATTTIGFLGRMALPWSGAAPPAAPGAETTGDRGSAQPAGPRRSGRGTGLPGVLPQPDEEGDEGREDDGVERPAHEHVPGDHPPHAPGGHLHVGGPEGGLHP